MLKDWQLVYDKTANKWGWSDIRTQSLGDSASPSARRRISRNKNGFFPYEFNFLIFQKESITQCYICGIFRQSRKMTREHVWPKSLGGDKTYPACRPCNQAKTNSKPIEWAITAYKTGKDIAVIPGGYDPNAEVA